MILKYRQLKKFVKSDEGSTSIMLAILSTAIVGAFGLMIEVGFWRYKQSNIQSTADMAVLAGAYQYIIENDKRMTRVAAFADASENSYDDTIGNLTVNIPPVGGDYTDEDAVQVVIEQEIPTFVSHMFLTKPVTATVSAVAKLGGQTSKACVLALSDSGTTISVGGNVTVTLDGCGMHANSDDDSAVDAFGNVTIRAACLSASGGVDFSGRELDLDECSTPRENQPKINDPYSDVSVPTDADTMSCNNAYNLGKGKNSQLVMPIPALNGGVVKICNSSIDLSNTVNLMPGTYIFDGTEINFKAWGELVGDDVTLIFMNDAKITGLNGNNTLNLTAPRSGDYEGIVMYADRETTRSDEWDFKGNADISLTGVVYLPTLDVDYGGGAGTNSTECTQIVANTVSFTGNSGFNSNCEAWGTRDIIGGAYTTVQLVE